MAHSDSTATPHPSTRETRGLELYRHGGIERVARDLYIVPSRSRRRVEYLVDLARETCECEDHHRNGGPCLHAYAALLYRAHLRRAARTIAPVLASGSGGDEDL
jgi:hypothetical protein